MSRSTRNLLSTLGTQLLSWALAFTVSLYVPAYLSVTQWGMLSLVGFFTNAAGIFLDIGISRVLIRDIARDPDRIAELYVAAVLSRLPLVALATLAGAIISQVLGYEPLQVRMIVLGLSLTLISQLNGLTNAGLQGQENFGRGNAAQLVERTLMGAIQILLAATKQPLWTFVALPAIGTLFSLAINLHALAPRLRAQRRAIAWSERWRTIVYLFRAGAPFLSSSLLYALWEPGNGVLISKLARTEVVGWYGLTRRLVGSALIIPVALANVTLPTLSRRYVEGIDAFHEALRKNLQLALLCAAPVASVLLFASDRLLELIHYLPKYAGAVPVLQAMGLTLPIWYLSQLSAYALLASDRQDAFSAITARIAVVCVPLCAACIFAAERLMGNGAVGAVVADSIIEGYLMVSYLRALPPGLLRRQDLRFALCTLAATLPLALALRQVHRPQDLYLLPIGLIGYALACLALGCLRLQDLRQLRPSLAAR